METGTEMVRGKKMPDRGGPPLGLRVLFGGGQLGACDRPWPLFHTCLAVFAVSDINIYHISHFGEHDNSQRWKNNKR